MLLLNKSDNRSDVNKLFTFRAKISCFLQEEAILWQWIYCVKQFEPTKHHANSQLRSFDDGFLFDTTSGLVTQRSDRIAIIFFLPEEAAAETHDGPKSPKWGKDHSATDSKN